MEFGLVYNVVIDIVVGMVFVFGSDMCVGGLYMILVCNLFNLIFVGCFDGDGYIYDV